MINISRVALVLIGITCLSGIGIGLGFANIWGNPNSVRTLLFVLGFALISISCFVSASQLGNNKEWPYNLAIVQFSAAIFALSYQVLYQALIQVAPSLPISSRLLHDPSLIVFIIIFLALIVTLFVDKTRLFGKGLKFMLFWFLFLSILGVIGAWRFIVTGTAERQAIQENIQQNLKYQSGTDGSTGALF